MAGDSTTLLIAPDTGLPAVGEQIQDIVNALHPDTLLGNVTRFDVSRALNGQTRYEMVWFVCHGGPDGILLSDGVMNGRIITQLLRGHPLRLVYLNTCDNAQVALDLHDATQAPVICTIEAVDVDTAYFSGATLAKYIAGNMSPRMAFEMSRQPNDATYRMIGGDDKGTIDRVDMIIAMLTDMREELQSVSSMAKDNAKRIGTLEDDIGKHTTTLAQALSWTIGYWLFVAIFLISVDDIREAAGFSMVGSVIVIILMAAIAYVPLSRALRMEIWDYST